MRNAASWVARKATARGRTDIATMRSVLEYLSTREVYIDFARDESTTGVVIDGTHLTVQRFSGRIDFTVTAMTTDGRRIGAIHVRPRHGKDAWIKLADLKIVW